MWGESLEGRARRPYQWSPVTARWVSFITCLLVFRTISIKSFITWERKRAATWECQGHRGPMGTLLCLIGTEKQVPQRTFTDWLPKGGTQPANGVIFLFFKEHRNGTATGLVQTSAWRLDPGMSFVGHLWHQHVGTRGRTSGPGSPSWWGLVH